jgi:hypothetical protein
METARKRGVIRSVVESGTSWTRFTLISMIFYILHQMLNSLDERIRYERNDSDVVHREAFERRISELKRRIEAGMKGGQLTLDEACSLAAMLRRIREKDAQFRSDGLLTREERIRLNQMLTYLEDRIYEERWDADVNHPIFR